MFSNICNRLLLGDAFTYRVQLSPILLCLDRICLQISLGLVSIPPSLQTIMMKEQIKPSIMIKRQHFSHLSSNFQGQAGTVSLESFIEGTIADYCNTMARRGTWADNVVIINMAKMLEHDTLIVTSSPNTSENDCLLWVSGDRTGKKAPLLLGHLWENHYQSLQPIEQTGASLKRKQDDDRRQLKRDGMYLETSHLLYLQYPFETAIIAFLHITLF